MILLNTSEVTHNVNCRYSKPKAGCLLGCLRQRSWPVSIDGVFAVLEIWNGQYVTLAEDDRV